MPPNRSSRKPRTRNPSPARYPVLTYASPDVGDLVFYIEVESKLKPWKNPTYGELYRDKDGEYPNHKLVLVTAADEDGWMNWYYAADRDDQGAYNMQFQQPSSSEGGFASYTRTYIVPREDDRVETPAVAATGELTTTGNQDGTETVTIDGQVVTFVNSGPFTADNLIYVPSSLTADQTVFVIHRFISGAAPIIPGVVFYNRTFSAPVTSTYVLNDPLLIEASIAGPSGNSITTTETLANGSFSSTTLTGGADVFETTLGAGSYYPGGDNFLEDGVADPDIDFDPELEGYVFSSLTESRIQDKELDSCYVTITRKFEKICDIVSGIINPITGNIDPVTSITRPNDGTDDSSPVDPVTGEYTVDTDVNCRWKKSITKLDSNGAALNVDLVGEIYDSASCALIPTTSTVVATGTSGVAPSDTTGIYFDVTPINALFSRKTTKVDPNWALLDDDLVQKAINLFDNVQVDLTQTIKKNAEASSLAPSDATGVYREVVPINDCLSKQVDKIDQNWAALNTPKENLKFNPSIGGSELQISTTVLTPVIPTEGISADANGNVTEYRAINGVLSEKIESTLVPAADGSGVVYTVDEQHEDPSTGIITDVIKAIVVYDKVDSYVSSKRNANYYVDVKSIDEFKYIVLSSKVQGDTLPDPETFFTHENISLPNKLVQIFPVYSQSEGGGFGSSSGTAKANSSVTASASFSLSVEKGYSGRAKAKIEREYIYSPTGVLPDLVNPVSIQASLGTVSVSSASENHSVYINKDGSGGSKQVSRNSGVSQVGPFLTPLIEDDDENEVTSLSHWAYFTINGVTSSVESQASATAYVKIVIPASDPISISTGDIVSRYQTTRKWRLGVWVVETIEVYAP